MSAKKVLSVAEIARELEIPESTVHYWKNRFAQHLPSVGKNRQKRFKPEAVEVFATIARMLKEGHTARDVKEHLAGNFPLTGDTMVEPDVPAQVSPAAMNMEGVTQMAQTIGIEIAKSIGEGIKNVLQPEPQAAALPSEELEDIRNQIEYAATEMAGSLGEMQSLKNQNAALKEKLTIMEAELIRLRKDRREMEKYLLDKIKSVAS